MGGIGLLPLWQQQVIRKLLPSTRWQNLQGGPFTNAARAKTGHARSDCYVSWTRNCSTEASREHFVSETVLRLIGDEHVAVNGVPWLRKR
jgi:hypothetical protein